MINFYVLKLNRKYLYPQLVMITYTRIYHAQTMTCSNTNIYRQVESEEERQLQKPHSDQNDSSVIIDLSSNSFGLETTYSIC